MAYPNSYMPGTFHLESPGHSRPALHADVFRAPTASPSTSNLNRPLSTGPQHTDRPTTPTPQSANSKRRRAPTRSLRVASRSTTPTRDWTPPAAEAPYDYPGGYFANTPTRSTIRDSKRKNPHLDYVLAGQIETPGPSETGDSMVLDDHLTLTGTDVNVRKTMDYESVNLDMDQEVLSRPMMRTVARLLYTDVTAPGSPPILPRLPGNGLLAFAVNTPINIFGKCVGKCWEFVKSSSNFVGFQAGLGDPYPVRPDSGAAHAHCTLSSGPDVSTVPCSCSFYGCSSHGFHEPMHTVHHCDYPHTPSRSAVKRRQLSGIPKDAEDMNHWIMVDNNNMCSLGQPCAHRRSACYGPEPRGPGLSYGPSIRSSVHNATFSTRDSALPPRPTMLAPSSSGRRTSMTLSRRSMTSAREPSPALSRRRLSARMSQADLAALAAREPASYAGARSSLTANTFVPPPTATSHAAAKHAPAVQAKPTKAESRRNSTALAHRPRALSRSTQDGRVGCPGSPSSPSTASAARGHRRSISAATPAPRRRSFPPPAAAAAPPTREDKGAVESSSPRLSDNAKKIIAQRRRDERDADARMEAFNSQLQDMIKQAKEALGTTVTIEAENGAPLGASKARAGAWIDDDDDI